MPESNPETLSAEAVIAKLRSRLDQQKAVLAFDADGTLWTGDVSDDVFLSACREEWLLDAAGPELARVAREAGLSTGQSVSQLALSLFEFQKQGRIAEVDLYALMAWCYAGRTLEELQAYTAKVLVREKLLTRIRPEVLRILQWARAQGMVCFVVSASPTPIVAWAASNWGFEPENVIGTTPVIENGVVLPKLATEVPFGANKCKLLRTRTSGMPWLASFGDSEFDFELLSCAQYAVAVHPKPNLLARLETLTHAMVLQTER